MTHVERPKIETPAVVPTAFPEYVLGFTERFTTSLHKPPMGILYNKDAGWNPSYRQTIQKVDDVCQQQEICAHGLENHLLYVAQNAFALSDATAQSLHSSMHHDEDFLFVALTHDLGYAHDDIVWQGKDAYSHQQKSAEWVNSHRHSQSHSSADQDHYDNRALLYTTVIQSNTDYDNNTNHLIGRIATNPTPEGLFFLTFSLADKLDFFRRSRLDGLQKPSSYEENPYFFMSDAVAKYTITSDEKHIYYTVQLNNADFDSWKSEVQKHFGWIFELGNTLGQIIGKEFVVQEAA